MPYFDELGELERAVMEVVWRRGKVFVKDVFEEMSSKRDVAPTTISTILDKLYKKGFLNRVLVREGGLRYLYTPALSREEYQRQSIRTTLFDLLEKLEDPTVASIFGDEKELSELKERLRRLVL